MKGGSMTWSSGAPRRRIASSENSVVHSNDQDESSKSSSDENCSTKKLITSRKLDKLERFKQYKGLLKHTESRGLDELRRLMRRPDSDSVASSSTSKSTLKSSSLEPSETKGVISQRTWSAHKTRSTSTRSASSERKVPENPHRKPPRPLDISKDEFTKHLTSRERSLCSEQRIVPVSFLSIKKDILSVYKDSKGDLTRRQSRKLFNMDVNKIGKVYDLLEAEGYFEATLKGWLPKDGIGTPGYRAFVDAALPSLSSSSSPSNVEVHSSRSLPPSLSKSSISKRKKTAIKKQSSSNPSPSTFKRKKAHNREEEVQVDSLSRSDSVGSDVSDSPLTSCSELSRHPSEGGRSDDDEDDRVDPSFSSSSIKTRAKGKSNQMHHSGRNLTTEASFNATFDNISMNESPNGISSPRAQLHLQEELLFRSSGLINRSREPSFASDSEISLEGEGIYLDDGLGPVFPPEIHFPNHIGRAETETFRHKDDEGSNLLQFPERREIKKRRVERETRTEAPTWSSPATFGKDALLVANSNSSPSPPIRIARSINQKAQKQGESRRKQRESSQAQQFASSPHKQAVSISSMLSDSIENTPVVASEARNLEISNRLPLSDDSKMRALGYTDMHPVYSFSGQGGQVASTQGPIGCSTLHRVMLPMKELRGPNIKEPNSDLDYVPSRTEEFNSINRANIRRNPIRGSGPLDFPREKNPEVEQLLQPQPQQRKIANSTWSAQASTASLSKPSNNRAHYLEWKNGTT